MSYKLYGMEYQWFGRVHSFPYFYLENGNEKADYMGIRLICAKK